MNTLVLRLCAPVFAFVATTSAALAHHPLGGETPDNFINGLLSGIGHPIIGTDHLAFIFAVGLLAAVARAPIWAPILFVLGTLAGCLLAVAGAELAINEWLVLASVLILGGAVALGHRRFGPLEMGGFTLAGLFHGMAYAQAVIGAEMGPIVAYLLGFALVQSAIAIGAMLLAKSLWQNEKLALNARLGGAVVAGIAIAFAIEGVEGLIFAGVA